MEFKKGTLVRCKRSHAIMRVSEYRPAHTVKRGWRQEEVAIEARLFFEAERGAAHGYASRTPDEVVRLG